MSLRHLSRLVRGGLEQFIENADTSAPRFLTMVDGYRNSPVKLGLDNPSNVYSTARVRGDQSYVVRGKRGTVAILSFGYQVRAPFLSLGLYISCWLRL